jgi:hypothetical protein
MARGCGSKVTAVINRALPGQASSRIETARSLRSAHEIRALETGSDHSRMTIGSSVLTMGRVAVVTRDYSLGENQSRNTARANGDLGSNAHILVQNFPQKNALFLPKI